MKNLVVAIGICIGLLLALLALSVNSWTDQVNIAVNVDNLLTKSSGTSGTLDAGIASSNVLLPRRFHNLS